MFSRGPEFVEEKKLAISRLDLSVINCLLWRTLQQQKLYRQDFRDVDHLKLQCWVR